MNSTVKVALLVAVIAVCLGFVVMRLVGGKGGGANGAIVAGERDLYCTECKTTYKAVLDESSFMPLMMAGQNANPKHTCANCGKAGGVAAVKCGSCGELVPSPGMQAMMSGPGNRSRGALCPKCKKPISTAPSGAAGAGPAR